MKENKEQSFNKIVPIFFAADDGYIPFMAVCIQSILEHTLDTTCYVIKILHTNISEHNRKRIMKYERNNIKIEFVDLNYYIEKIEDKLYTRDYYTKTTYFRLFIPNLYPQYSKAIYMDSDIVVLDDIGNLFDIEMEDNLIAGVTDGAVTNVPIFQEYVEKVVGMADWHNYFNAGLLLMNLDELRKYDFQNKFIRSLERIKFPVAQDQDYLNRLCKGRVKMIDPNWDVMPMNEKNHKDERKIKLIHYNLSDKPWHMDGVPFEKYFWEYAKKTEFYDEILDEKNNYTEEQRFTDIETGKKLIKLAQKEADCVGDDRKIRRN